MYTNINTHDDIKAITSFPEEIPDDFPPIKRLLEILEMVMTKTYYPLVTFSG